MNDQNLNEEKTLKKSMVGALLLAIWGIAMAAVSSSGVIMLDGMFNLISAIMSFFSLEITRLVSGKETRDYPLGYFAYESLIVLIKGASILVLLIMAVYSSIRVLLAGGREPALGLMTIYVGVAVLGCLVLYGMTKTGQRKTDSDILNAETRAWLVNAVVSGAIGVAFGVTLLLQGTRFGWIDRYVDQILVIGFSILFIKDPLVLMKNGLRELLLAAPQREYAEPYEKRILPLKEQLGARRLALEIMKTGRRMWVTVKIDPQEDTVSVGEFMETKRRLREIAREVYENTDSEVVLERVS